MATLDNFKKQASSFIHEKYKTARLVLTDVTPAELLTEDATNSDSRTPDAKTMSRISEAAFDMDDYWRIVDVLHRRLYVVEWNEWRQSYKALVVLEFLLTHGPEAVAEEFLCDGEVIEDLGTFRYVDERGFDWGAAMRKKSERILELLLHGRLLKEERLKALRLSREIQGFGNMIISAPSSTGSPSAASTMTTTSPFSSDRSCFDSESSEKSSPTSTGECSSSHTWEESVEESGSLLDEGAEGGKERGKDENWLVNGGKAGLRSLSNVGRVVMKKLDRQWSIGF
ncbi:hypothetical protein H6P81_011839 [Aristolochia fimbriata]|uniref:ENTH domain-containing protein n=1 Tax=Aristolochia fimbriata TaxID=158543 RepID=A0AAV7ED76_ARIFI|nr:hypothetical protein H6P81_011839 [Aristolochia fimbriata]